jgi:hypothetical protein
MLRILFIALALLSAMSVCSAELRTLNWQELIPADAPPQVNQPIPLHNLSQLGSTLGENAPATLQQYPSAPVVSEMDGQKIRIPGYIVPLEVDDEERVTEFLLVPYFGACIHVPPPPSNQIIHSHAELGVRLDALYQPFWVEGQLRVAHSSNELADAGYQMAAEKIYPYDLPDN